MKSPRTPDNEEPAAERACDFRPVDKGFTEEMALAEAERCLNCKKPFCVEGCPVNINIPRFIEQIRAKDFGGALDTIREDSMLPAICGRVCPQENQCEGKCIRGKKSEPVAIGQLERFLGDRPELASTPKMAPKNGKKVAVVGSGPSGITCAGELARNGFDVTVFEAFFTGGGVLVYGIPEFRLPKAVVKREIDGLEDMGVKFEYNSVVGNMATAEELFEQGFDAIYVATGAGLPKFLNVPGENLPNVFFANEYLTRVNLMKANKFPEYDTPTKHGKNVVVFGGGNVAMDAVRTAKRLGAEHAIIAYRRTEDEMPCRRAELDIPAGDVRVKVGGGHAGHNGLRSIIDKMGSRDFSRIRTGIGNPPGKMAVADYVLKQLRAREAEDFQDTCTRAADAAGLAIVHGVIYARDHVNGSASANGKH